MTHLAARLESLGPAGRQRVGLIEHRLARVPVGAAPEEIFDALASSLPVLGGIISTFKYDDFAHTTSRRVRMPETNFDSWWLRAGQDPERARRPLIALEQGATFPLFSSQYDAPTKEDLVTLSEERAILAELATHGLGAGCGYKVAQRPRGYAQDDVLLALLTDHRHRFSAEDGEILTVLNSSIAAALSRSELPLVNSSPLFAQLMEESAIGYVTLSTTGQIIESNRAAHELALRYYEAPQTERLRNPLRDFTSHILSSIRESGGTLRFFSANTSTVLRVSKHFVAKETHVTGQDLILLTLQEYAQDLTSTRTASLFSQLSPRERQIATTLATTASSRREIAEQLGISEKVARAHINRIYHKLEVYSRADLCSRVQALPPGEVSAWEVPRSGAGPTPTENTRIPEPQASLVSPALASTQAVIELDASLQDMSADTLSSIIDHIVELSSDSAMRLKSIRRGSVVIVLEMSEEGYRILRALRESGQLRELCGVPVLDVRQTIEPVPGALPNKAQQTGDERQTVFVGYSRRDSGWRDRLAVHFRTLPCNAALDFWNDDRITPGRDSRAEVLAAMNRARAAILLISADYLACPLVADEQIPTLLQRRSDVGVQLFPLLVRPCPWKGVAWLASMSVRPRDQRFLAKLRPADADTELAKFAEEVSSLTFA